MSTPNPRPTAPARLAPDAVLAAVDAVLDRPLGELVDEARALDGVHQELAAALATLDGI